MLATVDGRLHEELENWQIMPITFAEICEWVYMSKKKEMVDHTGLYHLLYIAPDPCTNTIYLVVLCSGLSVQV